MLWKSNVMFDIYRMLYCFLKCKDVPHLSKSIFLNSIHRIMKNIKIDLALEVVHLLVEK